MNFFLLAFVIQIFGLYAMILLSDYLRLHKSPILLDNKIRTKKNRIR